MRELLEAPASLVLPASMHVLRQESTDHLYASAKGRTEGLASATIPVLELRASKVTCYYLSEDPAIAWHANVSMEAADLPVGFQALWLRTDRIRLNSTGFGANNGVPVKVNVAEEVCRFLGKAPWSYREFVLLVVGHLPLV